MQNMYLTAEKLAPLVARYGQPQVVQMRHDISRAEMDMVLGSRRDGRAHDVTCFILDGAGRVAVIRKPFHPPGVWRAPSGGVHAGEDPEEGTLREMREETGLEIALVRYLLRIDVVFTCDEGGGRVEQPWASHVFQARPLPVPRCAPSAVPAGRDAEVPLAPRDRREIAAARWVTLEELQGPIREALLATGQGLFRYRVALTDLAVQHLHGALRSGGGGALGCWG